jgi:phosphoglycerol transferase MdoB-like AlkP superfamily enzyme
MKSIFAFFLKFVIFWVLFFTVQRVLFYIHFHADFDASFIEVLSLPFHTFQLDISTASFLVIIPFILNFLSHLIFNKYKAIFYSISKWITFVSGFIIALIFSGELVSYTEWRSKLTSKIFVHLGTPSEVFRTASGEFTWWFLFYVVIQLVVLYVLYRLIIGKFHKEGTTNISKIQLVFSFLILSVITVISARGGLQPIPISVTNAYYSNSQILNDLSVNSTWSFVEMTINYNKSNSEKFFTSLSESESITLVDDLFDYEKVDSVRLFKTNKPDIIFVTLEGWSTQLMGCYDGEQGITPNFDKLSEDGVLFTNVYATSSTSETGHSSIFSGYPTIPRISISHQLAKCRSIPSIVKSLPTYNSAYYFGGSLEYGNIGGYLNEIGFQNVYDEDDIPELASKGYLGYHDGAMFPYFLSQIQTAESPYIYGMFTQSTHSPYDMPEPMMEAYPDSKYASSLHYADKQIKLFTDELKQLPNFENTLVVFISDHGKTNFKNTNVNKDEFFHIPVLFWGGALKDKSRGVQVEKLGSQIDISKTLLNQLSIDTSPFNWSKDLLNPNAKEWAMFSLMSMYGIVTKNGYSNYMIYTEKANSYSKEGNESELETELKKCKAFNESVYREFKDL